MTPLSRATTPSSDPRITEHLAHRARKAGLEAESVEQRVKNSDQAAMLRTQGATARGARAPDFDIAVRQAAGLPPLPPVTEAESSAWAKHRAGENREAVLAEAMRLVGLEIQKTQTDYSAAMYHENAVAREGHAVLVRPIAKALIALAEALEAERTYVEAMAALYVPVPRFGRRFDAVGAIAGRQQALLFFEDLRERGIEIAPGVFGARQEEHDSHYQARLAAVAKANAERDRREAEAKQELAKAPRPTNPDPRAKYVATPWNSPSR